MAFLSVSWINPVKIIVVWALGMHQRLFCVSVSALNSTSGC